MQTSDASINHRHFPGKLSLAMCLAANLDEERLATIPDGDSKVNVRVLMCSS